MPRRACEWLGCTTKSITRSPSVIERQNRALLRRYLEFRRGADAVATWQTHSVVVAVSLIGYVARAP